MSVKSRSLNDSIDFGQIPSNAFGPRGAGWIEQVSRPSGRESTSRGPHRRHRDDSISPPPPPPPPVPTSRTPVSGRGRKGGDHSPVRRAKRLPPPPSPPQLSSPPTALGVASSGDRTRSTHHSPHTPSYNYGRYGPKGQNTSSMYSSPIGHSTTTGRFAADLTAVGSPIPMTADDSDPAATGALALRLRGSDSRPRGSPDDMRTATMPPSDPRASPDEEAEGADYFYSERMGDGREMSSPQYVARQGHPQPTPFGNESSALTVMGHNHSSAYTSAIVQALSMQEGTAMATTSQQTLSTVPLYSSVRDDGEDGGVSRGIDLYEHAKRVQVAKQQWVSLEKARQEILEEARLQRDCPFQPQVSPYSAKIQRPPELRPENRARGETLRRKQWVAQKKQQQIEEDLEECTFRPLTLRTARQKKDGAPRSKSQVFSELYQEARARQHFETAVQPQVVNVIERHVVNQGSSGPAMTEGEIEGVVTRLFSRGTVITAAIMDRDGAAKGACPQTLEQEVARAQGITFKPELSKETRRIVEEKVRKGERDRDVVNDLYERKEAAQVERQLVLAEREEEERQAQQAAINKREEARQRLEMERFRGVLAAKFRVIAKHAWQTGERRTAFRPTGSHSVVRIARAALDILTPDETAEILAALENCGVEKITQPEFVFLMLRHVLRPVQAEDGGEEGALVTEGALTTTVVPAADWKMNPLLTVPPTAELAASARRPPSRGSSQFRAGSVYGDPMSAPPPELPRVRREKADPAELERLRRRREEQMLEWREEARRRAEVEEFGDPDYKPMPRQLIPYECRPDVHVPTRTNRAAQLREAHVKEQLDRREEMGYGEGGDDMPSPEPLVPATAPHPSGGQQKPRPRKPVRTEPTARPLFVETPTPQTHVGSGRGARYASTHKAAVQMGKTLSGVNSGRQAYSVTSPRIGRGKAASPNLSPRSPVDGTARRGRPETAPQHPSPLSRRGRPGEAPTSPVPVPVPVPAQPTPLTATQPAEVSAGRQGSSHSAGGASTYTGSIAEHAAFGGEEALMQLGRELLLKQLQEYQQRRSRSARTSDS